MTIVSSWSQVKNCLKWTSTRIVGQFTADGKPQYMANKLDENSATEVVRTLFVKSADSNWMRTWMIREIPTLYNNENEQAASSRN